MSPSNQTDSAVDVVAIGNAIVDVLAHAEDAFVSDLGLAKGSMNLVDADRSAQLYERMGPAIEASGGSAANTAAGVASLGGKAVFIGKVADDTLGTVFAHDLRATGVDFAVPPASGSAPTARSLILVTPDAQRTMNTFLGVAAEISADDVDETTLKSAAVTYIEGYLCGVPATVDAIDKAMKSASRVALTLSDSFWVSNQRETFMGMLPGVALVFANEAEACVLYDTDDVEAAVRRLSSSVATAIVTRSAHGSIVVHEGDRFDVPAHPVGHVVDTTGAGDLYAAGYLFGYTHGADPAACGRLGSAAAAEAISHFGARPQVELAAFVASLGL